VRDARRLDWLSPAELAETITETLQAAHDVRELRLIRDIRETALAAGAAAVGLSEVVAASTRPASKRSFTTRTSATTGASARTGACTPETWRGRAPEAS
jgi:hypothetical protein